MQDFPIGIFDSGVGGLTVVRALINQLPDESFIYFGDTAHVPYGTKTREELFSYAESIMALLLQHRVKAVVAACGTHSSVTLPVMEKEYSCPMLGVVKPGARAAAAATRNGRIGILATLVTVKSRAFAREIEAHNPDLMVFQCACPRLVPLIESGNLDSPEVREALHEYLDPLLAQGVDTLVLGCTHYPILASLIQEMAGKEVQLINPADETIDELKTVLTQKRLNSVNTKPTREFWVSGNDESFHKVGKLLLGDMLGEVKKYPI